jgi:hypothetical protein
MLSEYQAVVNFFTDVNQIPQLKNVYIERVIFNPKKSMLSINLITPLDYNEKYTELIYNSIVKRFPNYTISLIFSNDIFEDVDFTKKYIVSMIRNKIPSSNSWVENLLIDDDTESVQIQFPNQVSFHSFNLNGLRSEIEEFLKSVFNKKLLVSICENDNIETFFCRSKF